MTISEIAKMAGVSSAAVSRYLNNGSLSESKRVKIEEVINKTGYVPSSSARAMRTGSRKTIGAIVPNISSESIAKMVSGAIETLESDGYDIILADTDNNVKKELTYIETLVREQVAGIIFFGTIITDAHIKLIKKLSIPVVIIGQKVQGVSCVYFNDKQASYDMTEILMEKKCTGFAYIGVTDKDKAAGKARHDGVNKALKNSGLTKKNIVEIESGFTIKDGYASMKQALKTNPKVNAVFCATDSIAVGAIMYLREHGKNIPEDIRITGIGHNEKSDVIEPQLTTAEYYYKACGIEAGKTVVQMLNDKETPVKCMELNYEILRRKSTDK